VKQAIPGSSVRRICRVLHVARSGLGLRPSKAGRRLRDSSELEGMLQVLIREHPTYGYRRLWALLRNRLGIRANRKRIYRILKAKRWLVHQRRVTPRPRVKASVSRTTQSDRRWAMDMTHVDCGRDGWAHLVGVIDCHDRELLGWEFALRGRAKEAERAIEEACIARFGTLRPPGETPVVRSDNGLIFQSRRFRAACRDYRLSQEFITPYTPEQNGIIERFFRSLKEECVWQNSFHSFAEAKAAIRQWIEWYNTGRPHQSLGYRSPREFRAQQQLSVA
jgi:putative transposase